MFHAYLILLLAIIAENVGTSFLKGSKGLKRPVYVIGALSGYVANFLMMGKVLALLPMVVAYGLWSGFGMAFVTLLGVLIYKEVFNSRVVIGLALIVAGVVILNAF